MCVLCIDEEDLLDPRDRRDFKMVEPWEGLKEAVLSTLEDGVKDFSNDLKAAAKDFLKDVATQAAKEKWRHLTAATQEEKDIAESNLRHLQGQVGAEIVRLQLVTTARAKNLLERVITTALGLLIRMAPVLLG